MKFKHLFVIGMFVAGMAASCSKADKAVDEAPESAAVDTLGVDSVLSDIAALEGDTVTVTGVCSHICKHGGKKAFLMGSDSTLLMCVADPSLDGGAFSPECPGKEMTVVGVVTPMVVNRDQLKSRCEAEAEHCDHERRAGMSEAACLLDSLNRQIEAGGDTTLTVNYYINTTSYGVTL